MINKYIFKNKKYLFLGLLLVSWNLFFIWLIFGWQSDTDTGGYLETIEVLVEHDFIFLKELPHRILRPGAVLLAWPLANFFSAFTALILENILFYFLSAWLLFKIAKEIFCKENLALYSVIFFITAYPLLHFGPVALSDMGAWFFYLLSIYLTLFFVKKPSNYLVYLNGFLSGLGVLMKEDGGMGILFFISVLLLARRFNFSQIFKHATVFLLMFLVPITINQLIVYGFFQYTYYDWYLFNARVYINHSYNFFNLAKNLFLLFGLNWLFFMIGAWRIFKRSNWEFKFVLYSLLVPSFSFLLWPDITARLMYIAGPFLALVAARGFFVLLQKRKVLSVALLLLCIAVNYFLVKLSYWI